MTSGSPGAPLGSGTPSSSSRLGRPRRRNRRFDAPASSWTLDSGFRGRITRRIPRRRASTRRMLRNAGLSSSQQRRSTAPSTRRGQQLGRSPGRRRLGGVGGGVPGLLPLLRRSPSRLLQRLRLQAGRRGGGSGVQPSGRRPRPRAGLRGHQLLRRRMRSRKRSRICRSRNPACPARSSSSRLISSRISSR